MTPAIHSNKAFISYSHSADAKLAPALQAALERFGKPWYRKRAFRIFRDTTNLSLAPELWSGIEQALGQSEFLLFLASPEAAASKWVKKELTHWLKNKGPSTLLIILTEGEIAWDDQAGDFDWSRTTSIPDVLSRAFTQEPFYLDFRRLRGGRLSLDDTEFLDHVATIAAPLHGKSKDEIYGEHIRQHRKTMRLAWSAVIGLSVLTITALWLYGVAEERRQRAERETRIATAQKLGALSQLALDGFPERSLLLAMEAIRITERTGEPRVPAAEEALRRALATAGGIGLGRHPAEGGSTDGRRASDVVEADCVLTPLGGLGYRSGNPVSTVSISPASRFLLTVGRYESDRLVAISPDGHWLLTMGDNASARLWDLSAQDPATATFTLHDGEEVLTAAFSPDGRWLATGGWQGQEKGFFANPYRCHLKKPQTSVRLWNLTSKDPSNPGLTLTGHTSNINDLSFSADNRWLVTVSADKTARVWDLSAKNPATSQTVLRGHEGEVYTLAITRDSRRLVTGSADGTARVWDLSASDPGASPLILRGHEHGVSLVAVSADGQTLVTGGAGTFLRLWNLAARDPSAGFFPLPKIGTALEWIRLSPNGRWLVAGGRTVSASLTDLGTRDPDESHKVLRSYGGPTRKAAFSPDSRWLLTLTGYPVEELAGTTQPEHVARLWDLTAANPTAAPIEVEGHQGVVFDSDFFDAGYVLATGSADGTVRLTRTTGDDNASKTLAVLRGHEDVVYRVAFGAGGRFLVTASLDGDARLWPLRGGFTASPLQLTTRSASNLTMSRDGHWLFSGDRVWDLTTDDPASAYFDLSALSRGRPDKAAFSPDGRWLLVSVAFEAEDGLFAWDLRGSKPEMILVNLAVKKGVRVGWRISRNGRWLVVQTRSDQPPHASETRLWNLSTLSASASPVLTMDGNGRFDSVDVSDDSQWLAAVADGRTVRLWKLVSSDPGANPIVLQSDDSVGNVRFDPGSRWLIAGNWEGADRQNSLRLWDLSGPRPGATVHRLIDKDPVGNIAFSPKARWLVTGSWGGSKNQQTARLWDLTASPPSNSPVVLDQGEAIDQLVFDPKSRQLATATFGKTIRFWDLGGTSPSSSPLSFPLQGKGTTFSAEFSPDGHWAVVSGYGQPSQLLDLSRSRGRRQAIALLGHAHPLVRAVISPDSHWLVTADTDLEPPQSTEQTCRIWDLTASDPGASSALLPRQDCQADRVAITPNGRWLATAGSGSGVRLWHLGLASLVDLAQRTAGRALTAEERREYLPAVLETGDDRKR
jgi:WD40 repeat protein